MSENTNASQGLEYNIDIVFCIDISAGMAKDIEKIRQLLLNFPANLIHKHESKGKHVGELRVRFVLFPTTNSTDTFTFSSFQTFKVPKVIEQFREFVQNFQITEEQAEIRNSLVALSSSLDSDWTQSKGRQRHIVFMVTNLGFAHETNVVTSPNQEFSPEIHVLMESLNIQWGETGADSFLYGRKLKPATRRLILFAPDTQPWPAIGDIWPNTVWLPVFDISSDEFMMITEMLSNGI